MHAKKDMFLGRFSSAVGTTREALKLIVSLDFSLLRDKHSELNPPHVKAPVEAAFSELATIHPSDPVMFLIASVCTVPTGRPEIFDRMNNPVDFDGWRLVYG